MPLIRQDMRDSKSIEGPRALSCVSCPTHGKRFLSSCRQGSSLPVLPSRLVTLLGAIRIRAAVCSIRLGTSRTSAQTRDEPLTRRKKPREGTTGLWPHKSRVPLLCRVTIMLVDVGHTEPLRFRKTAPPKETLTSNSRLKKEVWSVCRIESFPRQIRPVPQNMLILALIFIPLLLLPGVLFPLSSNKKVEPFRCYFSDGPLLRTYPASGRQLSCSHRNFSDKHLVQKHD